MGFMIKTHSSYAHKEFSHLYQSMLVSQYLQSRKKKQKKTPLSKKKSFRTFPENIPFNDS